MNILASLCSTLWRRVFLATALWVAYWPLVWFIKIGEVVGPKAWFWVVGELNYPFALIVYLLADELLNRFGVRRFGVLCGGILAVALFMLFFYSRGGFSFGVLAEAYLF